MLDLESLPAAVRQKLELLERQDVALRAQIKHLLLVIQSKDEELRLLRLKKWGAKSEGLSALQLELLGKELVVQAAEVAREAEVPAEKKQSIAGEKKSAVPAASRPGSHSRSPGKA